MFGRLLEDLRFVIGLFFAIVGGMLITVGTLDSNPFPDGLRLNLWAGTLMAIFAAFMIVLSLCMPLEDSHA